MQEVFGKIINELEELKNLYQGSIYKQDLVGASALSRGITKVRKVAEEYDNGWISASERLPEEYKLYDITFKNSAGIHSDSAIFNTHLKKWFWDADETELVENEILAWAEKREPYQPKGGEE